MTSADKVAARGRKQRLPRPLVRCVVFDLDDTLYDCFRQRVGPAHRHAAEAMVRAGLKASVEAVYRARLKAFRSDPTLRHIDSVVCRHFGADDPDTISHAAREAYFTTPVGRLKLFRGSLPLLRFLRSRGVRIFIVSFGEPPIQSAKARALGLENEPSVEAIYYADRQKALTKDIAFRRILDRTGLPPDQILVVGDRPMSEIRAGKSLGMRTVRLKRGEFAAQEPAGPEEEPDHVVRSISEVRKLAFSFGGKPEN